MNYDTKLYTSNDITVEILTKGKSLLINDLSLMNINITNCLLEKNSIGNFGQSLLPKFESQKITLSLAILNLSNCKGLARWKYASINCIADEHKISFDNNFKIQGLFYIHKLNIDLQAAELQKFNVSLSSTGNIKYL